MIKFPGNEGEIERLAEREIEGSITGWRRGRRTNRYNNGRRWVKWNFHSKIGLVERERRPKEGRRRRSEQTTRDLNLNEYKNTKISSILMLPLTSSHVRGMRGRKYRRGGRHRILNETKRRGNKKHFHWKFRNLILRCRKLVAAHVRKEHYFGLRWRQQTADWLKLTSNIFHIFQILNFTLFGILWIISVRLVVALNVGSP